MLPFPVRFFFSVQRYLPLKTALRALLPHSIGEMIPSVPTWLNFRDGKDEGDGESESDMWDEEMKSEHYDSVEEEPGRKRSPITWVSRGNATWRGKTSE